MQTISDHNSLIFKTKPSGNVVLILTAGYHRVNEKLVDMSHFIGTALSDEMCLIGGVPPFGHDQSTPTLIDEFSANQNKATVFWAAGGTPSAIFPMSSEELARIIQGEII